MVEDGDNGLICNIAEEDKSDVLLIVSTSPVKSISPLAVRFAAKFSLSESTVIEPPVVVIAVLISTPKVLGCVDFLPVSVILPLEEIGFTEVQKKIPLPVIASIPPEDADASPVMIKSPDPVEKV